MPQYQTDPPGSESNYSTQAGILSSFEGVLSCPANWYLLVALAPTGHGAIELSTVFVEAETIFFLLATQLDSW